MRNFQGSKYDAAISAGELPKGLKLGVRTRYFANGSSIDVTVKALPDDVALFAEDVLRMPAAERPHNKRMYSEALLNAYNHDRSDSMTDYFDVKFYDHVGVDWKFEQERRAAETARYQMTHETDTVIALEVMCHGIARGIGSLS